VRVLEPAGMARFVVDLYGSAEPEGSHGAGRSSSSQEESQMFHVKRREGPHDCRSGGLGTGGGVFLSIGERKGENRKS